MISTVKNVVTSIAGASAIQPLVRWLERSGARQSGRFRVLTYHRLGYADRTTGDRALFSATPETFALHLDLLQRDYDVVGMHDLLNAVRGKDVLPARAVLLTFDDAYRDFADLAWPVLKERRLPATLFVPTAYPGDPRRSFWWDRLCHAIRTTDQPQWVGPAGLVQLRSAQERELSLTHLKRHVKSLPHQEALRFVDSVCEQLQSSEFAGEVLSWNELRTLAGDGCSIGLHTRTHPLLNRVNDGQLHGEITEAWQELRTNIPSALPAFAYPAGAISDKARELLRATGIELAFTTKAGSNHLAADDLLLLRRIHVGLSTSANVLRAKLAASQPFWQR